MAQSDNMIVAIGERGYEGWHCGTPTKQKARHPIPLDSFRRAFSVN